MSDYIIPAIVFRIEKVLSADDLKVIMTDIRLRSKTWSGDGSYKAVLGFAYDAKTRGHVEIGVAVPYDPDGMDDVLLGIHELSSVKRFHAFDMLNGREHALRWKTGNKAPKPKSVIDPGNLRHGYDISKIIPGLRHCVEPDARREGEGFAKLLEGFPFADKSVHQNRDYMEMDVIAVLEAKFPTIYDANTALDGAVVRELRVIADPNNQSRLPDDWHWVVARMFQQNHPGAFVGCCKHVSQHIQILDYKDRMKKIKVPGITSRYGEQIIDQLDPITAAAVSLG